MNNFFSVLAKQHYYIYVLSGVVISFFFIYFVEQNAQIPILKKLIFLGIFIIIASGILLRSFYEKWERGGKNVPLNRYGLVIKDSYFLVKINSNISNFKKTLGYLYVTFRTLNLHFHGFVLGLPLFMWLKATYS